jgi:hypothetical protein
VAAAEGDLWLREAVRGDGVEPRHGTQRRWTARAGLLLGLVVADVTAEAVREALDFDGLDHEGARRSFLAAPTLLARGAATLSVLDRLTHDDELWGRLLRAGELAGVWASPFLWDPITSRRRSPGAATTTSPSPRSPL